MNGGSAKRAQDDFRQRVFERARPHSVLEAFDTALQQRRVFLLGPYLGGRRCAIELTPENIKDIMENIAVAHMNLDRELFLNPRFRILSAPPLEAPATKTPS